VNRVCVTGASGFIGRALCSTLLARGHSVRAVARSAVSMPTVAGLDVIELGEVDAQSDWSLALAGVDCVIHCAARAHVMRETESDSLATYRLVNSDGSRRLAEQATATGVRRMVYLSSIKVNGEQTEPGAPFLFSDAPDPEDPYGISKWEAEQALWEVSARTGLEVVVLRPPLVYGPGVKGNFLRLLQWAAGGVPLLLGAVHNQRSLVGLDNLVDLLIRCVDHPVAAGQTFLVSDGKDLSTSELLRQITHAMDKSSRLIPVPVPLLRLAGRMIGRSGEVDRLVGSLQIDSSFTRETLGWTPPVSVEAGMQAMVDDFLRRSSM
jgi:nucleoside-diphosphate-sugar epimerase